MLSEYFCDLGRAYDAELGRDGWLPSAWQLGDASHGSVLVTCRVDESLDLSLEEIVDWWLTEAARVIEPLVPGPRPTLALGLTRVDGSRGGEASMSSGASPDGARELAASLAEGGAGRGGWLLVDFGADAAGALGEAIANVDLIDRRWAQFEASLTVVGAQGVPQEVVRFWLDLAMSLIKAYPVSHAELAPEPLTYRVTRWEAANGRFGDPAVESSEQSLRGFGWTTFIPDALVDRLGGSQKLAESKALADIRIVNGGLLVRAIEEWSDFGKDAWADLEELLGPVLLPPSARER